MSNHAYCRILLASTMAEVRKAFTPEEIHAAWAWTSDRRDFEFHGPNDSYDYGLKMADCLWSAKAEGWQHLLDRLEPTNDPEEGEPTDEA